MEFDFIFGNLLSGFTGGPSTIHTYLQDCPETDKSREGSDKISAQCRNKQLSWRNMAEKSIENLKTDPFQGKKRLLL